MFSPPLSRSTRTPPPPPHQTSHAARHEAPEGAERGHTDRPRIYPRVPEFQTGAKLAHLLDEPVRVGLGNLELLLRVSQRSEGFVAYLVRLQLRADVLRLGG